MAANIPPRVRVIKNESEGMLELQRIISFCRLSFACSTVEWKEENYARKEDR